MIWYIFWGAIVRAHRECLVWSEEADKIFVNCSAGNHTFVEHSFSGRANMTRRNMAERARHVSPAWPVSLWVAWIAWPPPE